MIAQTCGINNEKGANCNHIRNVVVIIYSSVQDGVAVIHYFELSRNRAARREHANYSKVAVGSASDAI